MEKPIINIEKPTISLSRRDFLKIFTLGTGVAAVASLPVLSELLKKPDVVANNKKGAIDKLAHEASLSVADKLRVHEVNLGEKIPTFEEAREHLSLAAQLYAQDTKSPQTQAEILSNVFLIRHDYQDVQDSHKQPKQGKDSQIIKALLHDYPDFNPSEDLINEIYLGLTRTGYAWTSQEHRKIFIVLDRVTGNYSPNSYYGQKKAELPELQFKDINNVLHCEGRSSLVNLRSAFIHENVHLEGIGKTKKAEDILVGALHKAYTRGNNHPPSALTSSYDVDGLEITETLRFSPNSKVMVTHPVLKEFIADYVVASIATANNLPYTVGYYPEHNPNNLLRFREILTQSGISDTDVVIYNRNSDLREFLLKIAKGAKNIRFGTEVDALSFGMFYFILPQINTLSWENLKPYFPDVVAEKYDYILPGMTPEPSHVLGCEK